MLSACFVFGGLAFTACTPPVDPDNSQGTNTPDDGKKPGEDQKPEEKPDPEVVLTKYVQQKEAPVLEITTSAPIASKYDYVSANYKMTSESGEYDFTAEGEIRLRGNYTQTLSKKPYRVKFKSKQSPLGMPSSKSWYLLNEATDFSLMRNYLGYTYADDLMDYSLRARYVQVKVNGDYKGLYLLTDKRGEGKDRVPVTLTEGADTGWIIEVDNRAIGGDNPANAEPYAYCEREGIVFGQNAFYCNVPQSGIQAFVISEPDPVTPEQFTAISAYVTQMISSLEGNYANYIDVESMAKYFMVEELWHNTDVGSVYFYRENGADKVKFGPVWDLDLSCGISQVLDNVPGGATNSYNEWYYGYVNVLLKPVWQSAAFRTALKSVWNAAYSKQTADLLKGIDEVGEFLKPYRALNFERWNGMEEGKVWSDDNGTHLERPFFMSDEYVALGTWEKHVAAVKDFLTRRSVWMNTQIATF